MANIIQETLGSYIPKGGGMSFKMPNIDPYDAVLYSLIAILCIMIFMFLYRFFVYKFKILELEDRGRGSLKGRVLHAKLIQEAGRPKYKLWNIKGEDKKWLKINASPSDFLIPLSMLGFFYRDLVIMFKDRNGDYRPWHVITNKNQVDLKKYYSEADKKVFDMNTFLDDLFPLLRIDNQKMRAWYHLNVKETIAMYQPKSVLSPETKNVLFFILIAVAIMIGVYYFVLK